MIKLEKANNKKIMKDRVMRNTTLYAMLIPGILLTFIFSYLPMAGVVIAFKEYTLGGGLFDGDWVGLKYFYKLFSDSSSTQAILNTIIISLYKLVVNIPAPLILAIMINEVGNKYFKTSIQTISYLPHFISWVVMAGIVTRLLSPTMGIVTQIIETLTGAENVYLMTDPSKFRSVLVISDVYKGVGWGTLVYMAALSGIDSEQYEAAIIDGANRIQRIWYITLPTLSSLLVTLLIMSSANILNAGFDQIFNLQNDMVKDVSDIIDTYVYRVGLKDMQYSFSTAVGLFKSLAGLIMMVLVNAFSKHILHTESGIW